MLSHLSTEVNQMINSEAYLLFLTGMAFLFVHELDAIQHHEWRFFFSLVPVSNSTAHRLFAAAHIPLFVFILWNVSLLWFQIGFDIFLIIHAALHVILRQHPQITFNNGFSRLWVFGGALIGFVHLIVLNIVLLL